MKDRKQIVADLCNHYKIACLPVYNEAGRKIEDAVGIVGISQELMETIASELDGKIIIFNDDETQKLTIFDEVENLDGSVAELQFDGFLVKGVLISTSSF